MNNAPDCNELLKEFDLIDQQLQALSTNTMTLVKRRKLVESLLDKATRPTIMERILAARAQLRQSNNES